MRYTPLFAYPYAQPTIVTSWHGSAKIIQPCHWILGHLLLCEWGLSEDTFSVGSLMNNCWFCHPHFPLHPHSEVLVCPCCRPVLPFPVHAASRTWFWHCEKRWLMPYHLLLLFLPSTRQHCCILTTQGFVGGFSLWSPVLQLELGMAWLMVFLLAWWSCSCVPLLAFFLPGLNGNASTSTRTPGEVGDLRLLGKKARPLECWIPQYVYPVVVTRY